MDFSKSPIQRVEIRGLHNERNISLDLNSSIKILVDDNGSGKTTFLNLIVGILQGDRNRVCRYDFESIEIVFSNSDNVVFSQDDFGTYGFYGSDQVLTEMFRQFPKRVTDELILTATRRLSRASERSNVVKLVASELDIDPLDLLNLLRSNPSIKHMRHGILHQQRSFSDEADTILKEKFERIQTYFPYQILYFPTYRLVEENLYNLGYNNDDIRSNTEQLIQFGMEDVRKQWDGITKEMRDVSMEGFSRISGSMLDELTEQINQETIPYDKIADQEVLALVLSRSGDNISSKSRQRIPEIVSSGDIMTPDYVPLAYFLSNLIAIHESQKDKDDSINNFVKVVNGYLQDKEVSYDPSELSLQVLRKRDNEPIGLEKLSSGEKQIISIFSRLLLDFSDKQIAIFFDEPELSLSMEWQEKLIGDIVSSNQTAFLLAATHSPFIYEGDLLNYSDVLSVQSIGA